MIASVVWAMVAAYGVWCADRFGRAWLAQQAPVAGDDLATAMPDDLLALAERETEKWAREELKEQIAERYLALRDWNQVRRAFGVGVIA